MGLSAFACQWPNTMKQQSYIFLFVLLRLYWVPIHNIQNALVKIQLALMIANITREYGINLPNEELYEFAKIAYLDKW